MKLKLDLKTACVLLVALLLCGLGVTLFLQANVGSDTVTIFNDGLSKTLNSTYGKAALYFNITIVVIGFLISRKDMGIISVVYSLMMGYVIDFFMKIVAPIGITDMSFVARVIVIVVAQFFLTFSYALLIKAKSGMNPLDAIAYGIAEKFNLDYKVPRMTMDAIMLGIGFVLGGTVGVGTIFAVLTTGPLVAEFSKRLNA